MDKEGTALVLEGGGFRCMFTAGVLDVLQEHGIYGFTSVWGVSAGAINAVSYKAHQIGRAMRIMLAFRDDPRFMSLWSFVKTGNITGAEFMYDEVQNRLDPCDNDAFHADPMQFFAVASDVVFGTPASLPVRHLPDDVVCVQASASIPAVSRMVEIDGGLYLDGGMADSIPFGAALGLSDAAEVPDYEPARRALVVLTRDRDYDKDPRGERVALASHRYDRYPFFIETLRTRGIRYNKCRDELWRLEDEGTCLVIAPEKPVEVKTNETEGGKLLDLYLQGRRQAEARLDEIRAFLAGE